MSWDEGSPTRYIEDSLDNIENLLRQILAVLERLAPAGSSQKENE